MPSHSPHAPLLATARAVQGAAAGGILPIAIAEVAAARPELDEAWQPLAARFVELCRAAEPIGLAG